MKRAGFTLIELIVVMSVSVLLMGLAVPPFISWLTEQKVERRTYQLFADLKLARREAERQGSIGIMPELNNPTLVQTLQRRVYVALNTDNHSYRLYRWQDENMNGIPEAGEFAPDYNKLTDDGPFKEGKLVGVEFKRKDGLFTSENLLPCTNNVSTTTDPIVIIPNCTSITDVFGSEEYCIRFDSKGFYDNGLNNAKIFLGRGEEDAYGIALNLTGAMQFCRWDCDEWEENTGKCNVGEWKRVR